ncbi:hypothetical protein Bpfe_013847 [Biomphalaria pfeifferi]|uniref:C-type lectin domain-containing protein n=1 Tax=Biomphalaria pfeifferi TaxID=112525 RepID=A0AAD8FB34_BIOPF|nr:hypothetical protein Bpfe_013847 [Biomphalaria pfeifferi]
MNDKDDNIILTVDEHYVLYEGMTPNLEMECSVNRSQISDMASVMSMVISHSYKTEQPEYTYVASVNGIDGPYAHNISQDKADVSGRIENWSKSYLRVNFTHPSLNRTGLYLCEVYGFDLVGRPIIKYSSTVAVTKGQCSVVNPTITTATTCVEQQAIIIRLRNRLDLFMQPMFYISSLFNGHRYFLRKEMNHYLYSEAQSFCGTYGGYQVELDTHEEYIFIREFIRSNNIFKYVLTGATDAAQEGVWVNPHNSTLRTSFEWGHGEPADGLIHNCQTFYIPNLELADGSCDFTNFYPTYASYICEIPE